MMMKILLPSPVRPVAPWLQAETMGSWYTPSISANTGIQILAPVLPLCRLTELPMTAADAHCDQEHASQNPESEDVQA